MFDPPLRETHSHLISRTSFVELHGYLFKVHLASCVFRIFSWDFSWEHGFSVELSFICVFHRIHFSEALNVEYLWKFGNSYLSLKLSP